MLRLRWGGRRGRARCIGKERRGRDGEMDEEDREWMVTLVRYTEDKEVTN